MVPLGRKLPATVTVAPAGAQNLVKFPTLDLDLTQDISRRVVHRASDKVVTCQFPGQVTPVSKLLARPEVPSTPKPARKVNKLAKVKAPQPRDASATLMLPGVVDQAPKTPGRKLEVKTPAAPEKTGKPKDSSSRTVKGITRISYTAVSTPVKSVSDRCAMRSTAYTSSRVAATTPPQKFATKTPTVPTKLRKTSRFRSI